MCRQAQNSKLNQGVWSKMTILSVACVLLLFLNIVSCGFVGRGNLRYKMQLHVFSGRSNPAWTVTRGHPNYYRIASEVNRVRSTRLLENLGYCGFSIEVSNPSGQRSSKTVGAGSNRQLETLLLNSCTTPLEPEVERYVRQSIARRRHFRPRPGYYQIPGPPPRSRPLLSFCRYPRFDPENWNVGPVRSRNNCYNYATHTQTNTFAQPGRGSGRKFWRMRPDDVLSATLRDGLILMPTYAPHLFRHVCYIALVVWPGVDFHFYRLDSDMLWSHKPGRTAAKKTDDSGNLIRDPRFADRGNYVLFVAYLGNHPRIDIR